MDREEILTASTEIQNNANTSGAGKRVAKELTQQQAISILFRSEQLKEEGREMFENYQAVKRNQIEKCWKNF